MATSEITGQKVGICPLHNRSNDKYAETAMGLNILPKLAQHVPNKT